MHLLKHLLDASVKTEMNQICILAIVPPVAEGPMLVNNRKRRKFEIIVYNFREASNLLGFENDRHSRQINNVGIHLHHQRIGTL